MLTTFEIREASGVEPDWIPGLIKATTSARVHFRLQGEERQVWEDELCSFRWRYLKWKAEPLILPRADDWTELIKAIKQLLGAMKPFVPIRPEQQAANEAAERERRLRVIPQFNPTTEQALEHMSPRWWSHSREGVGEHHQALVELLDVAKRGLKEAQRSGRPTVDEDACHITRLLLTPYNVGFGCDPSPKSGGPTCRLVQDFFRSLVGEWCVERGGTTERFAVASLDASAPTLVEKAIEGRQQPRKPYAVVDLLIERFWRSTPT